MKLQKTAKKELYYNQLGLYRNFQSRCNLTVLMGLSTTNLRAYQRPVTVLERHGHWSCVMMRIFDIRSIEDDDYFELQATVISRALDAPFRLWYRFPRACKEYISTDNGDPFLPAILLPAMRTRENLEIAAEVSPRLLNTMSQIQDIYRSWTTRFPGSSWKRLFAMSDQMRLPQRWDCSSP